MALGIRLGRPPAQLYGSIPATNSSIAGPGIPIGHRLERGGGTLPPVRRPLRDWSDTGPGAPTTGPASLSQARLGRRGAP